MDNLLESNERTLILFDSVCSGLSSCLALVHADIKQMIEHRNRIAQLEQERYQQSKLASPQDLVVVTNGNNNNNNNLNINNNNNDSNKKSSCNKNGRRKKSSKDFTETGIDDDDDDDPHHLAGLKLLDKRLADSFSQALSMNDIQKSSIVAKQQANMNRPSIFQVLLGKTNKYHGANTIDRKKKKNSNSNNNLINDNNNGYINNGKEIDNRIIIDDINKQTRLAMQYSKQLEAHLFKVEDLRSKYEMHLKMGLVVKSVAKAYLSTGGVASGGLGSGSSHYLNHSDSLACRRQKHHCSSLVINDSSSSMATSGTRSSLSSLNLSTWSSSRSKSNKKRQAAAVAVTADLRINSNSKQSSVDDDAQNCYAYTNGIDSTLSKSKSAISHSSHSSLKGIKPKNSNNGNNNNSKTTIKEFIENIDRIEAEFESFMGSFLLAIEDIQGFARVCQGDVFEITIKYGDAQKFKTRISVLKDNRQKCDNKQMVFKSRIADILAIKAYECKGLGKRVLLGHKLCETRDLFTARSQLMTISLNQTGSIKLNLIVTWNPLHMAPNASAALPGVDISHITLPPTPVSSATLESLYQSVDPTYGYYIPPPDYMTNDQNY